MPLPDDDFIDLAGRYCSRCAARIAGNEICPACGQYQLAWSGDASDGAEPEPGANPPADAKRFDDQWAECPVGGRIVPVKFQDKQADGSPN